VTGVQTCALPISGSKSSLWKHYLRAISEIRPKYSLIENVSALTRRGLDTVLCDLASIGYDAEWYCISASSIGALHRRQRIFIIAYPNQERFLDTWFEKQSDKAEQSAQRNNSVPVSWATRADICRAADGLPLGIHRIAALGNAVVPKCAEIIAKAIKEKDAY
jgi:DNA (cytosine-5)-methyltransferase 1